MFGFLQSQTFQTDTSGYKYNSLAEIESDHGKQYNYHELSSMRDTKSRMIYNGSRHMSRISCQDNCLHNCNSVVSHCDN